MILFTGKFYIILMKLLSSSAPGDFQVCSKMSKVFITDQDDGGALYHSQPVPNKRHKRGGHNLAADVANNQPGVTRH